MADRWTYPMPRWLFWPVLGSLLAMIAVSCLCGIGMLLQLSR